jgi:uridine phosphorylase
MGTEYPILEFDDCREAVIEPSRIMEPVDGIPERCVLPIYQAVIDTLRNDGVLTLEKNIRTSMGFIPVYRMQDEGVDIAVVHPGLCAPLATIILEVLIAFGCRKFVACGSAGVLDSALAKGTVVVPCGAVRDEGTSYHYMPPGREIEAQHDVVQVIRSVLDTHKVTYRVGKTWTTDGLYRETKERIARRTAEGCITVDMECSAFLAVAAFRGVRFGQLFATGDDVSGDEWDPRRTDEHRSFPERLFRLAVEVCKKL